MTYKDLLNDPKTRAEFFEEELGVPEERIPKRVVVTPIEYASTLPENFVELLEAIGLSVEEYAPGDLVLRKIGNDYLISDGRRSFALLLLGRGLVEFSDRIYLLSLSERVKDILFIGTAASLTEEVLKEDINVPKLAIPFESVSALHVDVNRAVPRADGALHREILEYTREFSTTKTHERLHATVTLFYQETKELLEYLRDIGVATIDMEVSAFYRIARYYNKRAAAVLRAADMPLHDMHYLTEKYERFRKAEKEKTKRAILRTIVAFGLGREIAKRL